LFQRKQQVAYITNLEFGDFNFLSTVTPLPAFGHIYDFHSRALIIRKYRK
jgi:hypothetical protein